MSDTTPRKTEQICELENEIDYFDSLARKLSSDSSAASKSFGDEFQKYCSPSELESYRVAFQEAASEYDSVRDETKALWDGLREFLKEELELKWDERLKEEITNELKRDETRFAFSLAALKPKKMPTRLFVDAVATERKFLRAERLKAKAEGKFQAILDEIKVKLLEDRKRLEERLRDAYREFYAELFDEFFRECRGVDDPDAEFPEKELNAKITELSEFDLLSKFDERGSKARDFILWEKAYECWGARKSKLAGATRTIAIGGGEYIFQYCPAGALKTIFKEKTDDPNEDADDAKRDKFNHRRYEYAKQETSTEGFWILEKVVPQRLFEEIAGFNPSVEKDAESPVDSVNWDDCRKFVEKLNEGDFVSEGWAFQIPTSAEMELARRLRLVGDRKNRFDEWCADWFRFHNWVSYRESAKIDNFDARRRLTLKHSNGKVKFSWREESEADSVLGFRVLLKYVRR